MVINLKNLLLRKVENFLLMLKVGTSVEAGETKEKEHERDILRMVADTESREYVLSVESNANYRSTVRIKRTQQTAWRNAQLWENGLGLKPLSHKHFYFYQVLSNQHHR